MKRKSLDHKIGPMDWLRVEYEKRKKKNPAFSMRAFARHLGISSGNLSDILMGKRLMSRTRLKRVLQRLGYTPTDHIKIFEAIAAFKKKPPA